MFSSVPAELWAVMCHRRPGRGSWTVGAGEAGKVGGGGGGRGGEGVRWGGQCGPPSQAPFLGVRLPHGWGHFSGLFWSDPPQLF